MRTHPPARLLPAGPRGHASSAQTVRPRIPVLARAAPILLLPLLVPLAMPAQAAYGYGTVVAKNDSDFQPELSIRATASGDPLAKIFLPCVADEDGDGRADAGEAIYIAVGLSGMTCERVRQKYVRLGPVGPYAAGSVVKAGESDLDVRLVQLGSSGNPGHALRTHNQDTQATLQPSDTLYLDLAPVLAPGRVGVGDLRLTAFGTIPAGSRVQPGDSDLGLNLAELNGGAVKSFYTTAVVYEYGNGWYVNGDQDAATKGVEEGDVRLNNAVPNLLGDIMANVANPGNVVDALSLSQDTVAPGHPFYATIKVRNPTPKAGSALVQTKVDGAVVDARGTPTLAPNGGTADLVVMVLAPTTAGQHKLQAGEYTFHFDVASSLQSGSAAVGLTGPASVGMVGEGNAAGSGGEVHADGPNANAGQAVAAAPAGQSNAADQQPSPPGQPAKGTPALHIAIVVAALALALVAVRRRM